MPQLNCRTQNLEEKRNKNKRKQTKLKTSQNFTCNFIISFSVFLWPVFLVFEKKKKKYYALSLDLNDCRRCGNTYAKLLKRLLIIFTRCGGVLAFQLLLRSVIDLFALRQLRHSKPYWLHLGQLIMVTVGLFVDNHSQNAQHLRHHN